MAQEVGTGAERFVKREEVRTGRGRGGKEGRSGRRGKDIES